MTDYYSKPAETHPADATIHNLMGSYISGSWPTWDEWRAAPSGAEFRLGQLYGSRTFAIRQGDWLIFRTDA